LAAGDYFHLLACSYYVYIVLKTLCKTSMLMLTMNFCNILKCLCYLVLDFNLVNIMEFME